MLSEVLLDWFRRNDQAWSGEPPGELLEIDLQGLLECANDGAALIGGKLLSDSTDGGLVIYLGVEGDMGEQLGLSKDWANNAIKAVGNYSESFERNIGVTTPLALERGLNALWTDGGILYSPPMR